MVSLRGDWQRQHTEVNPSQKRKRPLTHRSALALIEGWVCQTLALTEQEMGNEYEVYLFIDTHSHNVLYKRHRDKMKAKCIVLWYEMEVAKISTGSLPRPTVKSEV